MLSEVGLAVTLGGRWEMTRRESKGSFWGADAVLFLGLDVDYMGVFSLWRIH